MLVLAAAADAVLHPSREQLVLFPISLGVVVILLGGRIPRRVPRPQVRAPARQTSTPILMLVGPLALTAPAVLFALAILVPAGQIAAAAMVALLMFEEATVVLVLLARSRRQLR